MTEIAAAIGRVQLGRLAGFTARRQSVARRYDEGLSGVVTPTTASGATHVYHQYTVRVAARDDVLASVQAAGVDAAVYYPVPTHRLPAYDLVLDLPETERAVGEVLSLPMRPGLSDEEVDRVISAVNEAVNVHA